MSISKKISEALNANSKEALVGCLFLFCLTIICLVMGYNTGLLVLMLAAAGYFVFINKNPEVPLWLGLIFILPIRIPVSVFGTEYQIKLLFFGLVLISLFSLKMKMLKEKEKPVLPFIIPMLLLLALFIVGALRSEAPFLDKPYFLRSFIFRSIFFYLVLNIYGQKDLPKLIKALSLTSIVLALTGIYQHLFKAYFISNCNLPEYRAMGTFDHPNQFALFIFIAGVLSAGMLFYSKNAKQKIFYGAVFLLNLTALLMAYSLSLWLCLLAGLALFFIMYNKKTLVVFAASAVLLVFIMPANYKARFTKPVNMSDPSHQIRAGLISNGWNMIKNNPVFGVGDGNSFYQYEKYKIVETLGVTRIHTQVITLTAEYGFLGLLLFVYLMVLIVFGMVSKLKLLSREDKILQFALIAVFAGLLLNAQFNGNFFQESYVWLMIALGLLQPGPATINEKQEA